MADRACRAILHRFSGVKPSKHIKTTAAYHDKSLQVFLKQSSMTHITHVPQEVWGLEGDCCYNSFRKDSLPLSEPLWLSAWRPLRGRALGLSAPPDSDPFTTVTRSCLLVPTLTDAIWRLGRVACSVLALTIKENPLPFLYAAHQSTAWRPCMEPGGFTHNQNHPTIPQDRSAYQIEAMVKAPSMKPNIWPPNQVEATRLFSKVLFKPK